MEAPGGDGQPCGARAGGRAGARGPVQLRARARADGQRRGGREELVRDLALLLHPALGRGGGGPAHGVWIVWIPSPGHSDQGHLLLRQKEKGEVERDTLVWGGLSPAPAPAMGSMLHTAR